MFGVAAFKIGKWIIGPELNGYVHVFDAKIELVDAGIGYPSLEVVEGGVSVSERFVIESNGLLVIPLKKIRLVAIFSQNSSF